MTEPNMLLGIAYGVMLTLTVVAVVGSLFSMLRRRRERHEMSDLSQQDARLNVAVLGTLGRIEVGVEDIKAAVERIEQRLGTDDQPP